MNTPVKLGSVPDYKGPKLLGDIDTSNLLLLNVIYHKPRKEAKWMDFCSLVFKDVSTGEKKLVTISEPEMIMYVVKPEYRDYTYCPMYKELDKCEPVKVKYRNILDDICELVGEEGKRFKEQCRAVSNFNALKNIHKYPYVLGTDIKYPDYFRSIWNLFYHNHEINREVTKTYLDIEVDSIDIAGFPPPGSCPVNAVSYVDEKEGVVYVYLLRNEKNPLIAEFEDNIEQFRTVCHNAFDESYGRLHYEFFFYDENKEIDLLRDLFNLINKLRRDFLLIWNMGFDIPFMIERINVLGYDPREIMCDPEFVEPELYYKKDRSNYDFKNKNDSFTISSFTTYLDQMMQYIKVRKGKSELKSVKLNAIAKSELDDEKLDYSDEANIKTLPYVNYEKFVLYNIKDTLLLMGIEKRTHDIDNIFDRALTNGTPYESLFSQTVLLKNRTYISFFKQGYILGNNRNVNYAEKWEDRKLKKDSEDKYAGAIVGDPMLNDHVGITLFGKKSRWIFEEVVDFDFSSMYPFAYIAHNCGQESMVGKIVLEGFDYLDPNPANKMYDGGKMFIEAYLSRDMGFVGSTYFDLPTTEELLVELEEGGFSA